MLCSQLGSTTRNSTDAENSKFGREYCYVRHGPTTLLAALDIATGAVFTEGQPRHRHQEFLSFLRRLDAAIPEELEGHLIVDNYATHPPNADLVGAPSPQPPPHIRSDQVPVARELVEAFLESFANLLRRREISTLMFAITIGTIKDLPVVDCSGTRGTLCWRTRP
jgi:hypothetical protein